MSKPQSPKVLKTIKVRFEKGVVTEQIRSFEKANPGIPFETWVRGLVENVMEQMARHGEFNISKWQVFITSPALIQKALADEAKKLSIPDQRLSVVHAGKIRRIPDNVRGDGKRVIGKRSLTLVNDAETEVLGQESGEAEAPRSGNPCEPDEGQQEAGEADRQG